MLQPLAGTMGVHRESAVSRKGLASARSRTTGRAPVLPPRPKSGGPSTRGIAEPVRPCFRPPSVPSRPSRVSHIVAQELTDPPSVLPTLPHFQSPESSPVPPPTGPRHSNPIGDVEDIRRAVEAKKRQQAQEMMRRVLSHVISPGGQDTLDDRIAAAGTKFVSESMRIIREDNAGFGDAAALITHLQSRLEWLLGELGLLEERYVRALERREAKEAEVQRQAQELQTLAVLLQLQQKAQEARRHEWDLQRQQLVNTIDGLQEDLRTLQDRLQSRGPSRLPRPFGNATPNRQEPRLDGAAWFHLNAADFFAADSEGHARQRDGSFLHADCERRLQELKDDNAALNLKLQETILKTMYGNLSGVEVSDEMLDIKSCWDALAQAKAQHQQLMDRHRKFQEDSAAELEEVRIHYEEELRVRLKDTSTAWREKMDALKILQAENKAMLVRYKAMEELVANTLTRLDRLQSVTLTGPSALTLLDKIRKVDVVVLEDPNFMSRPSSSPTPHRDRSLRSLVSMDGEEGKLRDAVLEAVDSSPGIRRLLTPEFYAALQEEIQKDTVAAVTRHAAKASKPTSPLTRGTGRTSHQWGDIHVPQVEPDRRALTSAGSTLSESTIIPSAGQDPSDAPFPVLGSLPSDSFLWPGSRLGSAAGARAPRPWSAAAAGRQASRVRDVATETDIADPTLSPDHVDEQVLRLQLAYAHHEVSDLRQSVVELAKQLAMFPMLLDPPTFKQEYDAKCEEVDQLHRVMGQLQRVITALRTEKTAAEPDLAKPVTVVPDATHLAQPETSSIEPAELDVAKPEVPQPTEPDTTHLSQPETSSAEPTKPKVSKPDAFESGAVKHVAEGC